MRRPLITNIAIFGYVEVRLRRSMMNVSLPLPAAAITTTAVSAPICSMQLPTVLALTLVASIQLGCIS
jgi:hypothetical protein